MSRSRARWLALGVALPTVLLGVGWLAASARERASRVREIEGRLEGVAAAVRGAVDEGLEELRRREDERPFYLYNHYYSPPDVLAISDPVAVSPLAAGPRDERVIGWFQVDPDGTVRTPWTATPDEEGPPEAARVRALARSDALADLRALVRGRDAGQLVARARPSVAEPVLLADAWRALQSDANAPVTVALNADAVSLANEIQQAQAGDVGAFERISRRGRQAPVTTRRSVALDELQQSRGAARPPPQQPVPAPVPDGPPLVPTSIEVDYTPMQWRADDDAVVLTRVVSHEGAAVLQGVVLDRAAIASRWVPEVIARVSAGGPAPRVIEADRDATCALRRPASETLHGLDLCFEHTSIAASIAALDGEMRWQVGALIGLVLAVAAAALAIARASRRAEELAMQRSAFVSAVSHELRTPLTTIRMHAEMLEDDLVDDARRPRVYREIATESVRLTRLVENVLEISRLEEGRRALRKTRGDLTAQVRDVVSAQIPFASAKGCVLRAITGEPIELSFDAQAIEQIVVNLIDNAVKYAPGEIDVEVRGAGERVVIAVRDRGPGIPEAERSRVFERFHRVERAETAHKPGTGIGLSLVRDLARAHGGEASAHEREGGGCELRVELPRS
ncbi:sensor histidine kinase [Sandaracinus amylolyticus]|uniref:histidine kinase n=1 Tax=Sandaracinus amylolyticus TaxID=927083 RepID=A0A0F6WA22_9BACT|nr:HAMP domain-containing sensor histidine kinase [Sandaracinus amylolyticus]AKF11242.1 Osmosensitive K+ channel histidine kinase KdpD [Sandaracinus amylolyticus]